MKFLSEFDTLPAALSSGAVNITLGGKTVLAASGLTADSTNGTDGTCTLHDMAATLWEKARANDLVGVQTLGGLSGGDTSVLICRGRLSLPAGWGAGAFVEGCFLTCQGTGRRAVPAGYSDTLYFYADADETLAPMLLSWWVVNGRRVEIIKQTATATASESASGLSCVKIDTATFTAPTGDDVQTVRLFGFRIMVGDRSITYTVRDERQNGAPCKQLAFINAFNVCEKLHFWGASTHEAKPSYSTARVGGKLTNYQADLTPTVELTSGAIDDSELPRIYDFLRSPHICDTNGQEWIITESSIKTSDDRADYHTLSVTMRQAEDGPLHDVASNVEAAAAENSALTSAASAADASAASSASSAKVFDKGHFPATFE